MAGGKNGMSRDGKKKLLSNKPKIPFSQEPMNGKKLKSQFITCSSEVSFDGDVVTDVVKTVLTESDILRRSLSDSRDLGDYSGSSGRGCLTASAAACSGGSTAKSQRMLEQLECDDKLLNKISNKLSNAIMNNETVKQIVCDAVSLEVKEKIESLENEIRLSKSRNELLEAKLEKQSQYSRVGTV